MELSFYSFFEIICVGILLTVIYWVGTLSGELKTNNKIHKENDKLRLDNNISRKDYNDLASDFKTLEHYFEIIYKDTKWPIR